MVKMLDFSRIWLPYLYLYGVGGGIFLIGMFIILRSRSLKLERIRHREWYHILIFGLVYYMGIHALFTFAALGKSLFAGVIGLVLIAISTHLIFTLIKKPKGSV
jgi:hypothetical protein